MEYVVIIIIRDLVYYLCDETYSLTTIDTEEGPVEIDHGEGPKLMLRSWHNELCNQDRCTSINFNFT